MKKIALFVTAVFVLTFVLNGMAADKKGTKNVPAQKKDEIISVKGTLEKVDPVEKTVTAKIEKKSVKFNASDEICKANAGNIGKNVTIKYTKDSADVLIIKDIIVQKPVKTAAPKAKKTK